MTQLRHDSPVVYALYKGGFFRLSGELMMGVDSGGGEMTPGKKIDPKSYFVSEMRSFLYFHITICK